MRGRRKRGGPGKRRKKKRSRSSIRVEKKSERS